MQTSRRTLLRSAASAGLIGLVGKTATAQTGVFNYKVATNVPVSHPIYVRLTEAVEKIKVESSGKVNISVFPNGQLGSDTDMLSQVRSGGIDFLTMPGTVLANLTPVDFVLTIAISVSAGASTVIAYFPAVAPFRLPLALAPATSDGSQSLRCQTAAIT